jgi:Na+-driven multidrug efflux pump
MRWPEFSGGRASPSSDERHACRLVHLRIIFIQVGLSIVMDIRVVYWAYPVTWTISSVIFFIYYFSVDWMRQTK